MRRGALTTWMAGTAVAGWACVAALAGGVPWRRFYSSP
jgi:hypothetical protein